VAALGGETEYCNIGTSRECPINTWVLGLLAEVQNGYVSHRSLLTALLLSYGACCRCVCITVCVTHGIWHVTSVISEGEGMERVGAARNVAKSRITQAIVSSGLKK